MREKRDAEGLRRDARGRRAHGSKKRDRRAQGTLRERGTGEASARQGRRRRTDVPAAERPGLTKSARRRESRLPFRTERRRSTGGRDEGVDGGVAGRLPSRAGEGKKHTEPLRRARGEGDRVARKFRAAEAGVPFGGKESGRKTCGKQDARSGRDRGRKVSVPLRARSKEKNVRSLSAARVERVSSPVAVDAKTGAFAHWHRRAFASREGFVPSGRSSFPRRKGRVKDREGRGREEALRAADGFPSRAVDGTGYTKIRSRARGSGAVVRRGRREGMEGVRRRARTEGRRGRVSSSPPRQEGTARESAAGRLPSRVGEEKNIQSLFAARVERIPTPVMVDTKAYAAARGRRRSRSGPP